MTFGIPSVSLKTISELLKIYLEIDKAIIFGREQWVIIKKGSDVDIAIMGGRISPEIIIDISAALNERLPLPYYFDVVSY